MIKRLLVLALWVYGSGTVRAQVTDAASSQPMAVMQRETAEPVPPRIEFLPNGHLFDPILLDPIEAQTYASVLPFYWTNAERYPGILVPFAFGLRKPLLRWNKGPERASELSFDVGSFTQFEIYQEPSGRQRRQLVNTDYRVSILFNIRRGIHRWRIRGYHLSSHLGDDYLIRNQISYYLPNSVNYEQIDVTYSQERNGLRRYVGVGVGLRQPVERKRLSGQAGFYYRKHSEAVVRLVGGVDLKFWQQTNFRPGIKTGLGLELGRSTHPLTLLLESYHGFRPYSLYERQGTNWVGVGLYFNPI